MKLYFQLPMNKVPTRSIKVECKKSSEAGKHAA